MYESVKTAAEKHEAMLQEMTQAAPERSSPPIEYEETRMATLHAVFETIVQANTTLCEAMNDAPEEEEEEEGEEPELSPKRMKIAATVMPVIRGQRAQPKQPYK